MDQNRIAALEEWFSSQCDGDWEHGNGVRIETLDNPGWRVTIDLAETSLEREPFPKHEDKMEHETDWLTCWKKDSTFEGRSGPRRLKEIIGIFLAWVENREGR